MGHLLLLLPLLSVHSEFALNFSPRNGHQLMALNGLKTISLPISQRSKRTLKSAWRRRSKNLWEMLNLPERTKHKTPHFNYQHVSLKTTHFIPSNRKENSHLNPPFKPPTIYPLKT